MQKLGLWGRVDGESAEWGRSCRPAASLGAGASEESLAGLRLAALIDAKKAFACQL